MPDAAVELARGADVLVIDGLRPKPHPTHLSVQEAVEVSRRIDAARTFLIHMTWQVDHAEWSARLPAGVELAYDGLRVEV